MNPRSWNICASCTAKCEVRKHFDGKNYSIRQFKISAIYSARLLCCTK